MNWLNYAYRLVLAYTIGLYRALDFRGKTNRRDFWGFFLINLFLQTFNSTLMLSSFKLLHESSAIYAGLIFAATGTFYLWSTLAFIAAGFRRYRSMGKTPYLFLLSLIPVLGLPFLALALLGRDQT